MTRQSVFILFLALLLTRAVSAQTQDDGSIYSRYGIGELTSFASSQAKALGGAGTALFSYNYVNSSNPATWSRQTLVRVAVGARFNRLHAENALGQSEKFLRGNFNALHVGVPLLSGKLGLGLSYEPYSQILYRVSSPGTLTNQQQLSVPFQINHEGSGGLHQARIGLGLRLAPWISIGVSSDFLFGITEERRRTSFLDETLLETNLTANTRLYGVTASGGITLSFGGQNTEFVLAASSSIPGTLKGTRTVTLGESLDLDTLGASIKGELSLPYRFRGGLSFRHQNRWLIAAEIRHEPWSTASSSLPLPGFESGNLKDRTRYAGGIELIPAGADLQAGYLGRTAYRVGFYRDNLYISPDPSNAVIMTAITGGLGLPTLFFGTRLDLSFEIGTRGSTDNNLIRDRFIGVSATLNIGERWFAKRKLG